MTELILGTAQLRRGYGVVRRRSNPLLSSEACSFLRHAEQVGVDALDTAPVYGDAESTIGAAGTALAVHTKIDPALSPLASARRSLVNLRRERIDVLYIHDAAAVLDPQNSVIAEAYELVGSLVGRLGVSVYEVAEFEAALRDPRIEVVQVPMNLFDRRFTGPMLSRANDAGCAVFVRSVLLQGLLADPAGTHARAVPALGPHLEAVAQLAATSGTTALQLAIGWAVAQSGLAGMILGADSADDLDELQRIVHARLGPHELDALEDMALPQWPLADPRTWK